MAINSCETYTTVWIKKESLKAGNTLMNDTDVRQLNKD